jgi:hypothetical protein
MNNIDNINSINNMSSIHDSINDNLDSKTQWNVRMLILQNGICCGIFKNIASSSLLSDSSSSSRVPVTTSLLLALSIDGQFLLVCGSGAEIILENGERLGLTGISQSSLQSIIIIMTIIRNNSSNTILPETLPYLCEDATRFS